MCIVSWLRAYRDAKGLALPSALVAAAEIERLREELALLQRSASRVSADEVALTDALLENLLLREDVAVLQQQIAETRAAGAHDMQKMLEAAHEVLVLGAMVELIRASLSNEAPAAALAA